MILQPDNAELRKTLELFEISFVNAREIFIKKNNHFQNQFLEDGVSGVLVRLKDKIKDIQAGGKGNEDVYECLLDVANYALMAALIEKRNKREQIQDM